jgi:hypothetical protein
MSRFQGDPRLIITPDGSTLRFKGGQPVMDGGFENAVLISLFTRPGWVGNALFDDPAQRIGSDYEEANELPITIENNDRVREAAKRALANFETDNLVERIDIEVTNPFGHARETTILITAPGGSVQELSILKNGLNWLVQANDPAHKRL